MQAVPGMHPSGGYLPLQPMDQNSTLSNDLNTQQSLAQASRRLSRSSNSHRNSMRISKPSSASNSPQAPWPSCRRRTMMNDAAGSRRTQQVLEQLLAPTATGNDPYQSRRQSRPLSWHPDSLLQHMGPQAHFGNLGTQPYPSAAPSALAEQQVPSPAHFYQTSPMEAACSTNASPLSTFSPLPMQHPGLATANAHYLSPEAWQAVSKSAPFYPTPNEPRDYPEPFSMFGYDAQNCPPAVNGLDWQTYVMQGMNNTSPPTPDSLLQPEPTPSTLPHESPAFQTLDEPEEEEGEILVGMGLYDTPDKVEDDPQLDRYRSTVSSLLGSRFHEQQPQGKGLKLEETWAPPIVSDDEDDEDDEDDSQEDEELEAQDTAVKA